MLSIEDRMTRLAPMEADIFQSLLPAGRVISTARLIMRVWGANEPASAAKALWVHMFTLRRRISRVAGDPPLLSIGFLRGSGYVLLQHFYEPINAGVS